MNKKSPLVATLLLGYWLCSNAANAKWVMADKSIMGTNIHVEVWSDAPQQAADSVQAVMDEMHRIDKLMSPYIPSSELSQLNRLAARSATPVSKELFELIALSVELAKETEGAFDITFASIGYLYDYRENQKPDPRQVKQLLDAINYRHIQFNATEQSISFAHPNVKIDLGGIAKGHAVDNAIEILKKRGVKHALVTAGGDTKLLGNRLDKPWMVGIRDPRDKSKQTVVLPLADTALSTSGDYERYFEQDGKRYHHILSPKTGTSTNAVQSVSIVGPSSTLNDALSTAVFVLGVQKGIDLLNRTPGYDGIIIDNQRQLHYSNALMESFR
ncbi:FAD:protein FMN transferase [uncultured Paraglaciecola sp.]|uniref:FAD:protein FMN transferase n=1 Tax=uncultured Paraglaciecola sp. TaxID=1765024 RepID=UPI0026222986|nr:FAD:protein FMN transferase [uncultured Paraglaciecola sp.]